MPLTPRARSALGLSLRIAAALAVIAGCAWFVRNLDLKAVGRALAGANPWLVAAAAAVNFFEIAMRALRVQVLLAPTRRVSFRKIYRYLLASYAASTLLPARAGDFLRVWLLRAREGVPASTSVAAALAERGFELLGLLALAAPLPWLLPDLPHWVIQTLQLLAGLGLFGLCAAWALVRFGARRGPGLIQRFSHGALALQPGLPFALAMAWSILGLVADTAQVLLIAAALGAPLSPPGAVLALVTLSLALVVPSTPAQIGAFEIGMVVALDLLGIGEARALAIALVYHLTKVVPVTLVGIEGLRLASVARREKPDADLAA